MSRYHSSPIKFAKTEARKAKQTTVVREEKLLNTNMYIQLLNSAIEPEMLLSQAGKAGPEGVKFLLKFLSSRCKKLQASLNTIQNVALDIDRVVAQENLFKCMLSTTDAAYGTIYLHSSGSKYNVAYTNWPGERQDVTCDGIYGFKTILKNEYVNASNMKSDIMFVGSVAQNYRQVDPECILSSPIYGDGMKVIGLAELVNKAHGNPYFTAEDVFILNALASFATLMNGQSKSLEKSIKKQDDMKNFLSTASKTSTDVGG